MRTSRFAQLVVLAALSAFAASPLSAQRRSARSPDRAAEDWLDRCERSDRRSDNDRERFCELRDERLRATRSLDIDGDQNGSVSVHGWDREEIRVLAKVQTYAEDAGDAKALASRVNIEMANGRIHAEGPRLQRRESWAVSFEVWMPRETDLRVSTHNGSISVEDVQGRVDLGAMNGALALRNVGGDVRGETTNGALEVELDGDRWRGSGLDLRTTNGQVRLVIPQGYSARLETGTVNGGMQIDFPVTLQGSIGRRIATQLGNGGPPIRAVTTNGQVLIQRR